MNEEELKEIEHALYPHRWDVSFPGYYIPPLIEALRSARVELQAERERRERLERVVEAAWGVIWDGDRGMSALGDALAALDADEQADEHSTGGED